jgi:hypothetical protein
MPAKSKAQQRLMQAAEHGATFPMATKVRASMTQPQMHDFSIGSMSAKPAHVAKPKAPKAATGQFPHKNLGAYLHPKKGR